MLGRFMHFLFAVLFLTVSLGLVLISIGWTTPLELLTAAYNVSQVRIAFGMTGGFMMIVALYIFLLSIFRHPSQHAAIEISPQGDIDISFKAIENIIQQVAQSIRGVRNIKPIIRSNGKGVYVYLKAVIGPEINIPEASKALQDKVRDVLQSSAGLKIVEIRITVVEINHEERMRVH